MPRFLVIPILFFTYILQAQSQMDTTTKTLGKVVVRSKKPFVENQADKLVLNVQSDALAMGSSAMEILQRAPGVTVTGDDNINMAGKGQVNILIDGRPVQLSARDLATYLRSIPGSDIDRIEIISNPSSRYDAQGNGGIINIRFRKSRELGTSGSFGINYDKNLHHRFDPNAGINYRAKKINIFANYSLTEGLQHTKGSFDRYVTGTPTRYFDNNTIDIDDWLGHNFRAGLDYKLTSNSIIGLLVKGNIHHTRLSTPGETLISDAGKDLIDSSVQAYNVSDFDTKQFNYNLNYAYTDTLGTELSADLDFTSYKNAVATDIRNSFIDHSGFTYDSKQNLLGINTSIEILSFKSDYRKKMTKQSSLETGIKMSMVNTGNFLLARQSLGNSFIIDSGRTNLFHYRENVFAAYATYAGHASAWEYQLGLRAEYTVVKGTSTDVKGVKLDNPDTTYVNLFPTLFLMYTINDKNKIGISLNRRISRPNYQDMNPFETLIDIYSADKGNPYLKPEFRLAVELKYIFRDKYNFTAGYAQTIDVVQEITLQDDQKFFSIPKNLAKQHTAFFSWSLPVDVYKWWSLYTNLTITHNRLNSQLEGNALNYSSWGSSGYISNSFILSPSTKVQLSSWFRFPAREGILRTKPFGSIDMVAQKTWKRSNLTLRLGVNDIFNMQKVLDRANFETNRYTYLRKWESRGVRLGLSWKFGNKQVKSARDRQIAEDAGRIK